MSNVIKLTAKKPANETPAGPYWAGQPLREAFPSLKVRTPAQVQGRRLVIFEGGLCYVDDDGPEGTA